MTVYVQPDKPTDWQEGDIWVQTNKPTWRERRLIRRGKLSAWWGTSLPPEDIARLEEQGVAGLLDDV